ncbi:DegQ family serine endoprotease [candidate division WOR-3 bacterium]|nr:DegQ family serine endoprotease [candidate division WOR-3 bacterium]
MSQKISVKNTGIIVGFATVIAFLFGIILTASLPRFANQSEAQTGTHVSLPILDETGESPFVKIAEAVSPAVVNISAEHIVTHGSRDFNWRFEGPFEDLFRDFFRNFPRQEGKTQTLGSGFIISEDGYIVTNNHVIKDASEIIIRFTDKREFKGDDITVIGVDPRTDLALLKIKADGDLPFLEFGDSDATKVGEWAIAVGNPFHLEGTLTVGVISAKGRTNIPLPEGPDLQSFLQTDAAINPGNSGGPLVDIHGKVIGVNTAITSPSGGNVGIGFAIPANLVKNVVDALHDEGKVARGYLGVYLQEITVELQRALDLPSLDGVLISDVLEGTPADNAGLESGDVILEVDGKRVESMQSFRLQVSATTAGTTIKLNVLRDGKTKNINVKIGEYPDEVAVTANENKISAVGISVVDLSDPRIQRSTLKTDKGVFITGIERGSPAEDAGLRTGDIIIAVDKQAVGDKNAYMRAVRNLQKGTPVIFKILRDERQMYIALTP